MRTVCRIDDEEFAAFVDDPRNLAEIGANAEIRGIRDDDGLDLRIPIKRGLHILRRNAAQDMRVGFIFRIDVLDVERV